MERSMPALPDWQPVTARLFLRRHLLPWLQHRFEGYREGMGKESKIRLSQCRNAELSISVKERSANSIPATATHCCGAGNDEIAYGLWRSLRAARNESTDDISVVVSMTVKEAVLMDRHFRPYAATRGDRGKPV